MDFYFSLGYRQCGLKEIPIRVKYLLKGRRINLTTDIVAVAINLLDRKDIKNYWSLQFLVPNKHSSSQSFILLIQRFIRDVFITDSVLNSICVFNLIKFQNKFKDHDLSQEENARLDNLRRRMLLMGITIIKHEDLCFGGAIFKEEPDHAIFRYMKEDEKLLMKMQAPESVFWTFNLDVIFLITFFLFLCVDSPRLCLHHLAPSAPPNILPLLSAIPPPRRKRPSPRCGHLKPKGLMFETKRSVFSKPLIQRLLPMKIGRPANLTFDKMKYEFAKPFCPPSKTELGSDEEWATESSLDFVTPQLTNETEC